MDKSDIITLVKDEILPYAEKELKEKGIFNLYIYKDKEKFKIIKNLKDYTRSNWNNMNRLIIKELKKNYVYNWDREQEDNVEIFFLNNPDKETIAKLHEAVDDLEPEEFIWYYDDRGIDTLEMIEKDDYDSIQSDIIKIIKNIVKDKYNNNYVYKHELENIYLNLVDYINDKIEED